MNDINPVEFGKMKEQIEHLQKGQDELRKDMKEILALAERSKGGFWIAISCAAFFGSLISVVIRNWMQ
mgnify:FL=1|jgi:hypothetical protein